MLSLGVIWNPAEDYSDEIIKDIAERVKLIGSFKMSFNDDFKDFVYEIYYNELEEKIDKKYKYLINDKDNNDIHIVIFEFNSFKTNFHIQKNKYVYTELNELKVFIRNKYSNQIDNYHFDNIFHCTDDLEEFNKNYELVRKYLGLSLSKQLKKVWQNNHEGN